MSRIYLASSWHCPTQPEVLAALRTAGHDVYDFRNPAPGDSGFSWRRAGDVSAPAPYMETLKSDVARRGFRLDKAAMGWADICVLLLPCGRSAHLEAGYMAGEGKRVFVLLSEDKFEPELMYLLCTAITDNLVELLRLLRADESHALGGSCSARTANACNCQPGYCAQREAEKQTATGHGAAFSPPHADDRKP
jgi:nucleoside 2-deoxyribosyltransferase